MYVSRVCEGTETYKQSFYKMVEIMGVEPMSTIVPRQIHSQVFSILILNTLDNTQPLSILEYLYIFVFTTILT